MRDYGAVSPQFWTGRTGRQIRALGANAQVVALYLLTCPASSMIGLYYLPVPTLAHETGIPLEGASEALRSLAGTGFAEYDEVNEVVWVCEMGKHQIAETVLTRDNRHGSIVREAKKLAYSPLFARWFERYRKPFNLPEMLPEGKPLGSPSEAPPKPRAGTGQDQDTPTPPTEPSAPPALPAPPAVAAKVEPAKATEAAKPRARTSPASKPSNPLPFPVGEALMAIASTAGGRFAVGVAAEWSGGHVITAQKHIRKFPDLETWRRVGAWLGAGADRYRDVVDLAWVAGNFESAATRAREWDAAGRPPFPQGAYRSPTPLLDGRPRRVGPAPVSTAADFARDAAGIDPLQEILNGR